MSAIPGLNVNRQRLWRLRYFYVDHHQIDETALDVMSEYHTHLSNAINM